MIDSEINDLIQADFDAIIENPDILELIEYLGSFSTRELAFVFFKQGWLCSIDATNDLTIPLKP